MSHPDLDRLTSWVHGFDDEVESHVAGCADCRATAEALREEARILAREIGSPERLSALKAGLLQAAAPRRSFRGLLWQIPVAAAVLVGLLATLFSPGSRHELTGGRVALEDGRVVAAPLALAASKPWQLRAVDGATVRLSDRSTVDLGPGARISLAPHGARGVQAGVSSGRVSFRVAADPRRLTVCSPAGRVEAADGSFDLKIVEEGGTPVKNALAGAIITVFAGSISLSNANGTVEAGPGQSAVLAVAEAPLFLAAPQDKQEELLRRLEQLAATLARLEAEIAQLEQKNKQLKAQLSSSAPGPGAVWSTNGSGGVRWMQSSAPGATVIIEEQKVERKSDPNNPGKK